MADTPESTGQPSPTHDLAATPGQPAVNYRTLFEAIDEGFFLGDVIVDEAGRPTDLLCVDANPAATRLMGADYRHRRLREVDPNYEEYWYEILGHTARTGEPQRLERYAASNQQWYSFYLFRIGDEASRRIAVIFRDITERKRIEEQQAFLLQFSDTLRTQPTAEALANRALQLLADYMQLDRCYVGVYRLAEDRGEFPYQVGNDRVPPMPDGVRLSDFPDALRVAFDRTLVIDDVLTTAGLADTDRPNLSALNLRALVASTLRMGVNNPLWSIVAVSASPRSWRPYEIKLIEDVTERTWAAMERVNAEEALRQSEAQYRHLATHLDQQVQQRTQQLELSVGDLKRSNDNLQQFAYVASHDLQEPLRKIQQFGDRLLGQYRANLGPEGTGMLERMVTAAGRMSTLIQDLLSYSRVTTQQQALDPVPLERVLQQVLTTLDDAIDRSGAQLTIDPLPIVTGDELQLSQLFQNLLANALKFTKPGAVPHIQLRATVCKREDLPTHVSPNSPALSFHRIEVQDEGIGFDMQYADRIFEVFQRLHGRGEYAGTGIGLAICAKVAANHGGAITASSQPGQGATFVIYLPANP